MPAGNAFGTRHVAHQLLILFRVRREQRAQLLACPDTITDPLQGPEPLGGHGEPATNGGFQRLAIALDVPHPFQFIQGQGARQHLDPRPVGYVAESLAVARRDPRERVGDGVRERDPFGASAKGALPFFAIRSRS